MFGFDIAVTARQHNRLVVTATLAVKVFFKSTEVATNIGAAELVVKRSATEWAVDHNIECGHYAAWLAVPVFSVTKLPRLNEIRDA